MIEQDATGTRGRSSQQHNSICQSRTNERSCKYNKTTPRSAVGSISSSGDQSVTGAHNITRAILQENIVYIWPSPNKTVNSHQAAWSVT